MHILRHILEQIVFFYKNIQYIQYKNKKSSERPKFKNMTQQHEGEECILLYKETAQSLTQHHEGGECIQTISTIRTRLLDGLVFSYV